MGTSRHHNSASADGGLTLDLAIVSILWGQKYDESYVARLFKSVRRYLPPEIPFYCLSDRVSQDGFKDGIFWKRTNQDWFGWWQKLCLFERGFIPSRYLAHIDLDVVILKDPQALFQLVRNYELVCAADPIDRLSSSFLVIDTHGKLAHDIWSQFDPSFWVKPEDGDQDYLRQFIRPDRYPVLVLPPEDHYSYKCLVDHDDWVARATNENYGRVPFERVTMVNFHGEPKPHELLRAPDRWPLAREILANWGESPF